MKSILKSILIAAGTVAATVLLICVDPALLAAFKVVVPDHPILRQIAAAAEHVLDQRVVVLGIILYAVLVRSNKLRAFGILFGATLSQALLVSQLKRVFSRMRPADLIASTGFFGPMWHGEHNSFPGGHAAAAFALATLFAAWHPRWKWVIYSVATLITLTRIYLERHFFSDCFIGGCIGYWIAVTFLFYFDRKALKQRPKRESDELFIEI